MEPGLGVKRLMENPVTLIIEKEKFMKEITIAVPDDKYDLTMNLVKNLKFVKKVRTKLSPKEKFLKELEEAVEEVKLIKAGKKKGKPIEELLNEL